MAFLSTSGRIISYCVWPPHRSSTLDFYGGHVRGLGRRKVARRLPGRLVHLSTADRPQVAHPVRSVAPYCANTTGSRQIRSPITRPKLSLLEWAAPSVVTSYTTPLNLLGGQHGSLHCFRRLGGLSTGYKAFRGQQRDLCRCEINITYVKPRDARIRVVMGLYNTAISCSSCRGTRGSRLITCSGLAESAYCSRCNPNRRWRTRKVNLGGINTQGVASTARSKQIGSKQVTRWLHVTIVNRVRTVMELVCNQN